MRHVHAHAAAVLIQRCITACCPAHRQPNRITAGIHAIACDIPSSSLVATLIARRGARYRRQRKTTGVGESIPPPVTGSKPVCATPCRSARPRWLVFHPRGDHEVGGVVRPVAHLAHRAQGGAGPDPSIRRSADRYRYAGAQHRARSGDRRQGAAAGQFGALSRPARFHQCGRRRDAPGLQYAAHPRR